VTEKPLERKPRRTAPARARATATARPAQRYQRLPSGTHGLDPEQVRGDQAQRLRAAMIELIAAKGYPAVRIADLSKLAHVSPPTLYSLYADKEQLFLGTYEDVARRTSAVILDAPRASDSPSARLLAGMRAFADLAVREPQAISLLVLGAFGAGPKLLRKRAAVVEALEAYIHSNRSPDEPFDPGDLTVRAVLGGIREVTAARLREDRQQELPELAGGLAAWADCYPSRLPDGLLAPDAGANAREGSCNVVSERAQQARQRLPSGRSDLPRAAIVKSQRERIVDATAAIAAEKGLAALTIPEIAKRANVSNQTFYAIYPSKSDAFLGAQKVGMHQALGVAHSAYDAHGKDWPRAVAAGIAALLEYLASEPAHAHLTLVDTFAANPEAIHIRQEGMAAFRAYLAPGFELAGAERSRAGLEIVAEAVTGGIWQVLHHYIEKDSAAALPGAAPQLTYFALTPFLGAERAASVALDG
jgi:AcrR family transcriptional regulator